MGDADPTSYSVGLGQTNHRITRRRQDASLNKDPITLYRDMEYFDFQNINLIPKKCIVQSRSEINTCIQFGNYNFALPIIPANMECVINEEIAIRLAKQNYFYIYHRFDANILEFSKKMKHRNKALKRPTNMM